MLTIKYIIRETKKYGNGIFTLEDIKKDTIIWFYKLDINVLEFDEKTTYQYLNQLQNLEKQQNFLNMSFGKQEILCYILDDGKYINHANTENILCNCKTDLETGNCYAKRDIKAGEQLFEDYRSFSHPDFLYKLLDKYKCIPTYYELPKNN
jgi:hypothetical protein